MTGHPALDERDLAALLAAIRARLPGYLPDFRPGPLGPGAALLQILARDMQVLGERIEQAPVKNEMAFLDLLGLDTIAAQGARAPVVFEPRPKVPDGQVPAGTQVAAGGPGGAQIAFETEHAIALAAAKLRDVITLWPGRDGYADHSADLAAGRQVRLFEPLRPVPHEFYLAHDVHLALAGKVEVEVQFDLATPGSEAVELVWEFWDGEAWREFRAPRPTDTVGESFDGTAGLTRSGVVRLVHDCADAKELELRGITSYWIRARAVAALPPTGGQRPAQVERIRLRTSISKDGLPPDAAYADQLKLDLSNAFAPLGPSPVAGSIWYLASKEAFGRPGARLWFNAQRVVPPRGDADSATAPAMRLELWDGERWVGQGPGPGTVVTFMKQGGARSADGKTDTRCAATVPARVRPVEVNGEETYWARFRVTDGAFYHRTTVTLPGPVTFDIDEPRPPMLSAVSIDYSYTLGTREFPGALLTHNDFQWADRTDRVRGIGEPVEMLTPVADLTPTLYLGFDGPLPADTLGLYLDLEPEQASAGNPTLRWEGWDGIGWQALTVVDETEQLALPGLVRVLWPGTPAQLPRFGTPGSWIRARLDTDADPAQPSARGVHANATWAVQARTMTDELLGASNGQPDQVFFFRSTPVLAGEEIEVRELSGPRAAVELPLLVADLERNGRTEADLRLVRDPRTDKVSEVWVRWLPRPNLFFSGPEDRHYVVERTRGRLLVGDGVRGRIPPPGQDNIRARRYRSGGGTVGNVPAGAIDQLLSGVTAQGVRNPRPAEGGADAQPTDDVLRTGPDATRHRRQAVSAADVEALAREASPAVALARALPATQPSGLPAPGWITLVVVPQSPEPRPALSFGLRRQVERFLAARIPSSSRIAVVPPRYQPIGVNAVLAPARLDQAGAVHDAVVAALATFLHPLRGGLDGRGWGFGRDVYLSDIAALAEGVAGVDYVRGLELTVGGSPRGEVIAVPADRIVAAGPIRITLVGTEV